MYIQRMENQLESLQYPVGRFVLPQSLTSEDIQEGMNYLEYFPTLLSGLVKGLSNEELEKTYRPGGWTIRQVVHHCADSHMHAFIRFKLALTEDQPVIKPYEESLWAEQTDYLLHPSVSLIVLEQIHLRWVTIMKAMTDDDWQKSFIHPQYNRVQTLAQTLALYHWHGRHHAGHVRIARGLKD
jgi:hypothetical protein